MILRYRACRPKCLRLAQKPCGASVIKSLAGQKREKGKPEASSMDDGCPEHASTRSRANNLPWGGVLMSGDPYEKRVDLMGRGVSRIQPSYSEVAAGRHPQYAKGLHSGDVASRLEMGVPQNHAAEIDMMADDLF